MTASTTTFLNPAIVPTHYDLKIIPSYSCYSFYTGIVLIDLLVKSFDSESTSSDYFRLNYDNKNIKINKVYLQKFEDSEKEKYCHNETPADSKLWKDIEYTTNSSDFTVFKLPEKFEPDSRFKVLIEFQGEISGNMKGFYISSYPNPFNEMEFSSIKEKYKDTKYDPYLIESNILSTQFEAIDARSAFPCYDEPIYKASLSLTILVPSQLSHLTTLSNMPIKEIKKGVIYDGEKYEERIFEKTEKMSTYLYAWAIGSLESSETLSYTSSNGSEVKITSYATLSKNSSKAKSTMFASKVAKSALETFENFFGIPYPLPKLDLLAVPEFSAGAMENWGLLTFREIRMFCDSDTSATQRRDVEATIVHEVSHLWFGDLVTMAWWNDLWLNEGFASFIMFLGSSIISQDDTFMDDLLSIRGLRAYEDDALHVSKPIRQRIEKNSEISQAFDSLRYCKGSLILRMLCEWVGKDRLGKALGKYLEKYSYSNATSNQLFEVLGKELKKDITKVMSGFVENPGVPLVSLRLEGDTIRFEQKSFKYLADRESVHDECWDIPVFLKINDQKEVVMHSIKRGHINLSSLELKSPASPEDLVILGNEDEKGYYRVAYDKKLLNNIKRHLVKIRTGGKPYIATCPRSGYPEIYISPTSGYLTFFEDSEIKTTLTDDEKINGFKDFINSRSMLKILRDYEALLFSTYEGYTISELKGLIIHAGRAFPRSEKILAFAYSVYSKYKRFDLGEDRNVDLSWLLDPGEATSIIKSQDFNNKLQNFSELVVDTAETERIILSETIFSIYSETHPFNSFSIAMKILLKEKLDLSALNPSERKFVFRSIVTDDGGFSLLLKLYSKTTSNAVKSDIVASFGKLNDSEKIKEVLDFMMSDEVLNQDKYSIICVLMLESDRRNEVLDWVEENIKWINETYSEGFLIGRIISSMAVLRNIEDRERVRKFFETNKNVDTVLNRTLEKIDINIQFQKYLDSQKVEKK